MKSTFTAELSREERRLLIEAITVWQLKMEKDKKVNKFGLFVDITLDKSYDNLDKIKHELA